VGAAPEPDYALARPINALERERDPDGTWRRYANEQLAGPYRALFAPIDVLVFLAAPDLRVSRAWRIEQEHKLAAKAAPGSRLMSDDEVSRFVEYYERISRHMLAEVPSRADVVLRLGHDHQFTAVEVR
jgi:D-glycerate 3-kinase